MIDITPYVNAALLVAAVVVIGNVGSALNRIADEMRRKREERERQQADR